MPLAAPPLAEAEPVDPELASPEAAPVRLTAAEPASPLWPPAVQLSASESPEDPPSAVVSGEEEAEPEEPVLATVVTEVPEEPKPRPSSTSGPPQLEAQPPGVTMGSAVAEPVDPEVFEERFEALPGAPLPVSPEAVVLVVSAGPLVAEEVASEELVTVPEVPPLPESPEVADGPEEASPEEVGPEEPESPEEAELDPPSVPS